MSVQEALEYLQKNGSEIRSRCTDAAIPEILVTCQAKGFLNLEEISICKNNSTNLTNAQKWDKISEIIQRKQEITMEGVWQIFSGESSNHILKHLRIQVAIIKNPAKGAGNSLEKKIFWNVPSGIRQFVGREKILTEISNSFESNSNKSVITTCSGLGGIGKTTIAIEYAWMHRNKTNVFWFGAEKAGNLESQMIDLYQIHGVNSEWFESNEDWLLIFDNAENPADIEEFIPNYPGHILITSRNIQWEEFTLIEIDIFTPEENRCLCEKILQKKFDDHNEVDKLGKELGHLPLALTIALFYIKRHKTTISDYLYNFKNNERKFEMLNLGPEFGFKDHRLPSIYSTWMISYEKIKEENPYAAQFLVISAYYPNPDIIDMKQLNYFVFLRTNQFEQYDQVKEILIKYSMIKVEVRSFKIHRLVQQVLKIQFQKDETENIFLYCRLRMAWGCGGKFRELNEELYSILKRINCIQQNVIFRILMSLRYYNVFKNTESLKSYAQQNYEKMECQLPNISKFQLTLANFGYLLICKTHLDADYADRVQTCLDWIIKSYENLRPEEKQSYWDFFATLGDVIENDILDFTTFLEKQAKKNFEAIFNILKQDFENPQVKFISQIYLFHLLKIYEYTDINRFIEYCQIEMRMIQDLKGIESACPYIFQIYRRVGLAYEKICKPQKALEYLNICLEIYKTESDTEGHRKRFNVDENFLKDKIRLISNKIQLCKKRIISLGNACDELIAKCYSEFGFKIDALEYWKKVIAKPDAKYQSFIEISLIFHQMSNDSESIKYLTQASKLAKGQNLESKFNTILGYLTKSSENWDSCIEIQNILKTDLEKEKLSDCPAYREVIENLSFCHFAKGDQKFAQDLLKNHGIDSVYENFKKEFEFSEYKRNTFHLIDFPMIDLISNDLNYRFNKLMEYSEKVLYLSIKEIIYAVKIINGYHTLIPYLARDKLKFLILLNDYTIRRVVDHAQKMNEDNAIKLEEYFDVQNYIQIVKKIWGEVGSLSYLKIVSKGRYLYFNKTMAIQFFAEALKIREIKYGVSNIKCIPPLYHLSWAYKNNRNFNESLECSKRILEIFKISNLGPNEKFRDEFNKKISHRIAQGEHDISISRDSDCDIWKEYNTVLDFEIKFNLFSDYESDNE